MVDNVLHIKKQSHWEAVLPLSLQSHLSNHLLLKIVFSSTTLNFLDSSQT